MVSKIITVRYFTSNSSIQKLKKNNNIINYSISSFLVDFNKNEKFNENIFLECSRSFYSNQTNYCQYNWISQNSTEQVVPNYANTRDQLPNNQQTEIYHKEEILGYSKTETTIRTSEGNISSQNSDRAPNTKRSSYSVEELLKKDETPDSSKIHNLFYSIPPCGLLLDKSCTCNLRFIPEKI